MALTPFTTTNHQLAFKKYVQAWQIEHENPRDQHYYAQIYLDFLGNYDETMNQFLAESNLKLLQEGLVWCQYYWWIENGEVLGTLRYRLNDKEIYGQVGYDVSPQSRKRGVAKKMLNAFVNLMKGKTKAIYLTVPNYNVASIKVMEANDATFIQKLYFTEFDEYLNQYRIDLG